MSGQSQAAQSQAAPSQPVQSPQDAVERALQAARCDDCIVIADEGSAANLRWAGNSLTTNGVSRSRQLTVIAISRSGGEARVGVVSRAGVLDDQITGIVAEAEQAAADASPAEDAQPLVSAAGPPGAGWDEPAATTEITVLKAFAEDLGDAFATAAGAGRRLYGFAEHQMTSSFLGTSSGIRLRHDQPTGRLELNAKSADMSNSAWAGVGTRDFSDVDVQAMEAALAGRLGWAARTVDLPAGRYETLLPPTALADLMVYLYWSAGAKDALDGRTVFSKPGGGYQGRRAARQPAAVAAQRSGRARPAMFALRHRARVQPRVLGIR